MSREESRIYICILSIFLLGGAFAFCRYIFDDNEQEAKINIKSESIPSQKTVSQRIGFLYTHERGAHSEAIPIRKYTFPGGGFVEAVSMDGERIISNSCTIILKNGN